MVQLFVALLSLGALGASLPGATPNFKLIKGKNHEPSIQKTIQAG